LLGAGARIALFDDDMRLPLKRAEFARAGLDPNPAAQTVARFYANNELRFLPAAPKSSATRSNCIWKPADRRSAH